MQVKTIILSAAFAATLGFSGSLALAQNMSFGVKCQTVDSRDVLRADFTVENFNADEQGFVVCRPANGEASSTEPLLIAGALPLHTANDGTLSLEDFSVWKQSPDLSELVVQSRWGRHPVREFDPVLQTISEQEADSILGFSHSRPVKIQVCEPALGGGKNCSTQQVEVCGWNYSRWECKLVDQEVCTEDENCEPVCHEEITYTYFRQVASMSGTVTQVTASFCPYGIVHHRERYDYSRLVQERQCCESKVVNGVLTNVCTIWERY